MALVSGSRGRLPNDLAVSGEGPRARWLQVTTAAAMPSGGDVGAPGFSGLPRTPCEEPPRDLFRSSARLARGRSAEPRKAGTQNAGATCPVRGAGVLGEFLDDVRQASWGSPEFQQVPDAMCGGQGEVVDEGGVASV